jgi:sulfate-transporting ATPase
VSQVPIYALLSLPLVGAFAMFTLGVVAIYKASRVLNLAHGAMAMLPAYVTFELSQRGLPVPFALLLGVASGALLGVAVERFFVRALRGQTATAQTVATVAVVGLIVSITAKLWGTTPRVAVNVFPDRGFQISGSLIRYGQIGLFVVAVVASAGFFALFRFTSFGLAMRAAAQNRLAASLAGINPDLTTSLAWALGGALAATAGILLAAVTTLHPYSLTLLVLPAFVAALIGGLESFPGALLGAAIVGFAQGMVPVLGLVPAVGEFFQQVGAPQVVVAVVAFVVMFLRGQRFMSTQVRTEL